MDELIEEFEVILRYRTVVNTSTGEIKSELIKKSIDKTNIKAVDAPKKRSSKKMDESSEPQLILEDNKYLLNSAAIELLQLKADDKLDIKYEKRNKQMVPILGTDVAFGTKSGCKLTKSNTVACRGSKNQELAKYGTIFSIIPHETKDGLFVLTGNKSLEAIDEQINLEELDEELPLNLDLAQLLEDPEVEQVEEIDASFFKL